VTLEDVLEVLVGDIQDESDDEDGLIRRHSEHRYTCRGIAEVRKVFSLLGLKSETDSVTLSGFLTELLGAVPRTGDVVHHGGYEFRVIRASKRRAESIEITPAAVDQGAETPEAS
jgi:magnesium and cobalt transporter